MLLFALMLICLRLTFSVSQIDSKIAEMRSQAELKKETAEIIKLREEEEKISVSKR